MCAVSLNYNTFDKEFYDRRFCEFQIKEWNKNLMNDQSFVLS